MGVSFLNLQVGNWHKLMIEAGLTHHHSRRSLFEVHGEDDDQVIARRNFWMAPERLYDPMSPPTKEADVYRYSHIHGGGSHYWDQYFMEGFSY